MAENLRWILNTAAPDARVILWAHNAHVARTPFTMPEIFSENLYDMVHHISKEMDDDLLTIAASFYQGDYDADEVHPSRVFEPADADFLDGALARTEIPCFVLDLRAAPSEEPAAKWLNKKHGLRAQDTDMSLVPAAAYDAVYFIADITRAQKNPLAIEKFRSMQR